jgi:cytoskeleton protein RodZ
MISSAPDATNAAGAPATAHPRVRSDEEITCGEALRRARQRRGLTLQQIAQSTKIPLRHLEALERDELAALPAGMYRRAQVRAYADAVGLDRTLVVARLDRALDDAARRSASSVRGTVSTPALARGRTRVWIAGAAAVAIAAIALAMWMRTPPSERHAAAAAPLSPAAAAGAALAPDAPNDAVVASSGGRVDSVSAPARLTAEPPAAPPVSNAQPRAAPAAEITTSGSAAEPQLTVVTEPPGARVTVNGLGWGVTPATIRYVAPGAKRVRVTMEGYRAEERLVQVGSGRTATTLRIAMHKPD